VYPPFGTAQGAVPSTYNLAYDESANRLTVGLRFLWILPAAILAALIGIALFAVAIVSWFVIVFTGKHPKGMFDFMLKAVRYSLQVSVYGLLLTDKYPSYS
jgi:hypothetical protein